MGYSKLPRIRVHLFGYIFSPALIPTLATALLLPLLISLGIWQLHRATEKRQLEHDISSQTAPTNVLTLKEMTKDLRYRPVEAIGYFDNQHLIFLDNKIYKNHIGYQVFSPFILKNDQRFLLVNRGFIAISNRHDLPSIAPINGTRKIMGLMYFPSKQLTLKQEQPQFNWPLVLQTIELKKLTSLFNRPTFPFYLLLKEGDNSNLIKDWHPVTFPAYRHTGYAIQWFLLAATLVVIYLVLNTSRKNND